MKSWMLIIVSTIATVGASLAGAFSLYETGLANFFISLLYVIFITSLVVFASLKGNTTFSKITMIWFSASFGVVVVAHITQIEPVASMMTNILGHFGAQDWYMFVESALNLLLSFAILPVYGFTYFLGENESIKWIIVETYYILGIIFCLALKGNLPRYGGMGALLDSSGAQE